MLRKFNPDQDFFYWIVSRSNGRVIGVENESFENGAALVSTRSRQGDESQLFRFRSSDDPDYFFIENVGSGKVMDVSGISPADGVEIHQWDNAQGDNQKFKLEPVGGGYFRFIAKHSGKSLSVTANVGDAQGKFYQMAQTDSNDQLFFLRPHTFPVNIRIQPRKINCIYTLDEPVPEDVYLTCEYENTEDEFVALFMPETNPDCIVPGISRDETRTFKIGLSRPNEGWLVEEDCLSGICLRFELWYKENLQASLFGPMLGEDNLIGRRHLDISYPDLAKYQDDYFDRWLTFEGDQRKYEVSFRFSINRDKNLERFRGLEI